MRKKYKEEEGYSENSFNLSVGDLMAGLLFIVYSILIIIFALVNNIKDVE